MIDPTQSKPLTILLDRNAHSYAKQFAAQQANPAKGRRVYLNTLAVCGVRTYLKWLNIDSDISNSDCWHSGLRGMFNIADIILPNIGKLECLWLLPGESTASIPPETREDRLGYLVVQLEAELKQIELLGFILATAVDRQTETIEIDRLQPLESLFDAIAQSQHQINLNQWLSNIFTAEWQPIETILAGRITRSLAVPNSTATAIARGKKIQWQLTSLDREIILVLQIQQESSTRIALRLQLYPGAQNDNLPSGLGVSILDCSDRVCLSATTKDTDDWMQLEFDCQQGEEFQVRMNLAGVSVVERFIV